MMVLVTRDRGGNDPGDLSGRVIDPTADASATGAELPGLEVREMTETVSQASGRAAQDFGQLGLG